MAEQATRTAFQEDFLEDNEDTQYGKYMTFHLAKEEYGIEIRHVMEIIGIQPITEVPDMSAYVKGVINLRGKIIPVMDVRLRFNLPPREYDDRTCIIVVNIAETTVGLVVDKVNEVADIPDDQIEPPPKAGNAVYTAYIRGIGKIGDSVKILLDVNHLLGVDELNSIEEASDF